MFPNKSRNLRNPLTILGVGIAVLLLELVVHLFLELYEVFLYYTFIFIFAMLAWIIVAGLPKYVAILVGGVVFAILKIIYYVLAYYIGSSLLSCCLVNPIHVLGVNDVVFYTFGYYQITTSVLLEALPIHFLVFVLGAFIATLKVPK